LNQPLGFFLRQCLFVDKGTVLRADRHQPVADLTIALLSFRLLGRIAGATVQPRGLIAVAANELEVFLILQQIQYLLGLGETALGDEQIRQRVVAFLLAFGETLL